MILRFRRFLNKNNLHEDVINPTELEILQSEAMGLSWPVIHIEYFYSIWTKKMVTTRVWTTWKDATSAHDRATWVPPLDEGPAER